MNESIDFAELLRTESGYRSFEPWTETKTRLREYIVRVAQREIGALEHRIVALAGVGVAAEAGTVQEVEAVRARWKVRLADAKTEFEEERGKLKRDIARLKTELETAENDKTQQVEIAELKGRINQLQQELRDSRKWWVVKLDNVRLRGQLKFLRERADWLLRSSATGSLLLIEKSFLPFVEYPALARSARTRILQSQIVERASAASTILTDSNFASKGAGQATERDASPVASPVAFPMAEPSVREAIHDLKQPWRFFAASFYYLRGRLSPALTLLLFVAGMAGVWGWEKVHRQWLENGYAQLAKENKDLKAVRSENVKLTANVQAATHAKEEAESQFKTQKIAIEKLTTTGVQRDKDHTASIAAMQKNIDTILSQSKDERDKALANAESLAKERLTTITTKEAEITALKVELGTANKAVELAETGRSRAEEAERVANTKKNKFDDQAQSLGRVIAFSKDALEQLEKMFKETNKDTYYNKRYDYREAYRRRYAENAELKKLLQDANFPYIDY